jgi:hypothetical protein
MKRICEIRAVPVLTFVILLTITLITLSLNGCGSTVAEPLRGSAVELASDKNARAIATTHASDAAAIDAEAKDATAKALEDAAKADPTPVRIEKAVAARVDAASARAVANALAKLSARADADAKDASEAARKERADDAATSDLRHWVFLCRCIGLAGVAIGALLGGLLVWFTKQPTPGAPIGGIIAGIGMLVVAFGSTVTWLPLALTAAIIAGLTLWAILSHRTLKVSDALSHAVDALRGEAKTSASDALTALGKAVNKSGLRKRIDRARTTWKRDDGGNSG